MSPWQQETGEKCIMRNIMIRILAYKFGRTNHYEMGRVCGTYGREEKFTHGLHGEGESEAKGPLA